MSMVIVASSKSIRPRFVHTNNIRHMSVIIQDAQLSPTYHSGKSLSFFRPTLNIKWQKIT